MNKIKLIETVTRGSHIRKTVDPGLILGNEDNGYLMGDILDANATASLIESSQLQSDWNQTDDTEKDYIKNKPDLTSMFAAKQDAPSIAGTDGQIFSLNAQGKPTWINPVEGSVVDNSMSDISENPVQNKVIKEYVDDSVNALDEEIDSRKANKDGYYEQMGVGLAKNLEGSKITKESFFNRPTGGEDAELADGLAQLTEVKGKSVKYNQITRVSDFYGYRIANLSVSNDVFTVVESGLDTYFWFNATAPIVTHKYYLSVICSIPNNVVTTYSFPVHGVNNKVLVNGRNSWVSEFTGGNMVLDDVAGSSYAGTTFRDLVLIDLTAIGIDNLTTVEEVEAWLAENWTPQEYYPYSEGAVVNVNMTGLESFKRNLLNPETGKAVIIGAYSDAYGNYYGICGTYGTLTFTDAYGNESTITPDADGKFELDVPGTLTVANAGADCAVFLWWDGTKTEFSEYGTSIAKLDVSHIYGKNNGEGDLVQVFPDGACGIGDLQDILKVENGVVKAVKRFDSVDLGSLEWTYNSDWLVFSAVVTNGKLGLYDNAICSAYARSIASWSTINNNTFTFGEEVQLIGVPSVTIHDDRFSDTDAFKAAMNGVMLYYELATPELYTDLVYQGSSLFEDGTPVTLPVNYEADNWGIERILPVNSPEGIVTAAPTVACKYSIDAVEQLDTHTTEISDLYDKTAELNATKANKSGEYPEMVVGAAAALKGDNVQAAEFVFRKTGAPDNVASGLAQIESVKGKSLVWNQKGVGLSPNLSSIVVSPEAILSKTITVTSSTTDAEPAAVYYSRTNDCILGHKYLVSFDVKGNEGLVLTIRWNNWVDSYPITISTTYTKQRFILDYQSVTAGALFHIGHSAPTSSGVEIDFDNCQIFDLTLMFGAGNEPTTTAEFEKMFPLDYYDYNPGTIINNKATGIEAVGFNQWDEEWINGLLDSDGTVIVGNRIMPKNFIPIIGGATYFIRNPKDSPFICVYDANYNVIGSRVQTNNFTAPSNACYMKFMTAYNYIGDYHYDICLNISNPAKNGTYETYKKSTVALNIPTLTGKLNGEGESVVVCAEGLQSVGTAFDEGVIENGYLTKVSKHIGKQVVSGAIGDTITLTGCDTNVTAFLCTSEIGTLSGGVLTLTAAADNVSVYFKLAEPEVYVLDEPLPVTYQVDGDGTERRLPADTASEISAPFAALIRYSMDAVGTINNLPKDYDSTDGLDDLCSALATALGPALNGTLSISRGAYNATTHKYAWTVTFTPNAPQEQGE